MSLVDWRSLPVRVKRSRKRLYGVLADEYNLVTWMELPIEIKRSKKKLYDFIANELNIDSFEELPIECRRSTRLMYGFIQENGGGGSTPTLTVTVTDGADPITGATVTVDGDSETTGSDGEATFTLGYGDYSATIRASGYTTKTENIAFRSNHKNFTIALEQSGGTGTVTVTGVYGDNQPLTELTDVLLYTGDGVPTIEDDSRFVAIGGSGEDNVATLFLWDTTAHEPTQDTAIPYGTYNIYAEGTDDKTNIYTYNGTLTVDGDETVTITLTQE